ncbi:MAG: 16S rRNA (guanine(527)-N(7))-methyltransferase RsmG [Alphaproteobacteria bacterium]
MATALDSRTPLTPEEFAELTNVSRETLARLTEYGGILRHWQKSVNLVGRVTLTDIWRRHMLDSAQLIPHIPENAREIVDMGSGAGFPGLVLAIMLDRPVHLIEATGKKAAFLREAARVTNAPATVHNCRIEALPAWPVDLITARALAPMEKLLEYAEPFMGPNGLGSPVCLFLKGAKAEQELTEARKSWKMTVDRFPSITDPEGSVLRIQDLKRE